MSIQGKWNYLNLLVLILLMIPGTFADCSLSSNSLNREITVNSWTGNWTFEGIEVGTTSNDHYYLLSSADDNQWGIVSENASGEVVWARTYSNGQWSGLTLSVDKTWLYFSSAYNTDYYAIGRVSTVDGDLSSYFATSELTLTGKVTRMDSFNDQGGEIIEVLGNITSNTSTNLRVWFDPVFNSLAYFGPLDWTDPFIDFIYLDPSDWTIVADGLTLVFDSKFWSSRFGFEVFLTNETQIQLSMADLSQNDTHPSWIKNIVCTSTCTAADYTRSDFDETNVHFAANLPSDGKVLMMVLVATSGDLVGTMKTTQSSQQMALGSLSATNNSITWISAYSTTSSYSELIKFDSANNSYTVYQQTGVSYTV